LSSAPTQPLPPDRPLHESQARTAISGPDQTVGVDIGHFHVLERIGEGGFGVVYLAEQRAPVRRKVALKLLKPGMASREVLARFEAERQALAMMDHANVARVLEAGMTPDQRPYFAMEYVAGVPLTDYADSTYLSTKERVRLFIPVCLAVHHAHQKGIIHRDLKPSNILVTLVDGQAVPKVIDFGIAKALHAPLTERTLHTMAGRMMGTPEYISPEQAASGGIDVDTRTDVYSLGVILYQLLTGTLPFDSERLRSAGVDVMIRTIRELEPPKPSTRLSTLFTRTYGPSSLSPESIARARRTSPKAIARELAGDLDWITLKAMEKDRSRRYSGASDLAADLERHLNHEPVTAGPPGSLYRLGKFIRKNRVAVGAGAAVGLVLVGSLGVIGYLLSEAVDARDAARLATADAERARERAERNATEAESRRAEAVSARAESEGLSTLLLNVIGQADLIRDVSARDRTVSEMLDDLVRSIDAGQPRLAPRQAIAVRSAIGRAYASQGRFRASDEQATLAVSLAEKQGAEDAPLLMKALLTKAWALHRLEQDPWPIMQRLEKMGVTREAPLRTSYRLLAGHVAPSADQRRAYYSEGLTLAEAENDAANRTLFGCALALLANSQGQHAEAEELLRRYLKRSGGDFDENDINFGLYMDRLAFSIESQGRGREAAGYYRRALTWYLSHLPREHPDITDVYRRLRWCLVNLRDADGLRSLDAEIEEHVTTILRTASLFADVRAGEIAKVWRSEWQLDRAAATLRGVLEHRVRTLPPDHDWIAGTRGDLGETLLLMGRPGEALPLIRLAKETYAKANNEDSLLWLHRLELDALIGLGTLDDAEALIHTTRAARAEKSGAQSDQVLWADAEMALVRVVQRRYAEAEQILRRLMASYTQDPKPWGYYDVMSLLGACAAGQGRAAEGRKMLTQAAQGLIDSPEGFPIRKLQAIDRVIEFYRTEKDAAGEARWVKARAEYMTPEYLRNPAAK
jgi:serine/threonine protein kinase/tetratricopeptide (TPR) repeat protein